MNRPEVRVLQDQDIQINSNPQIDNWEAEQLMRKYGYQNTKYSTNQETHIQQNNGLTFDGNYSVLSRFTKRQVGVFHLVKCIVKVDPNILWDVHNAVYLKAVDTNHRVFKTGIHEHGDDTIAQINHYFCKTWDEFCIKRNRGRADMTPNDPLFIKKESDFEAHNLNEIEDTYALDFYLDKHEKNRI